MAGQSNLALSRGFLTCSPSQRFRKVCVRIRPNATLLSPGQDESPQTQASNDIRELLNVVKTIQVSMEVMSQNVIQLNGKQHILSHRHGDA